MSVFADVSDDMVAKLEAAGLPATARPDAVPPFVLVDLVTVPSGDHAVWKGEVPVRCVVPPPGDLAARTALYDLLEQVLSTLGSAPAFPGTYLTVAGKELPSYTVTYPVDFPNPNC